MTTALRRGVRRAVKVWLLLVGGYAVGVAMASVWHMATGSDVVLLPSF